MGTATKQVSITGISLYACVTDGDVKHVPCSEGTSAVLNALESLLVPVKYRTGLELTQTANTGGDDAKVVPNSHTHSYTHTHTNTHTCTHIFTFAF